MKITSLISSESNEHTLAFGTDPKMWPMVFDHFIVLARLDPTLKDFVWAVSDKSNLVLRSTGLINSVISEGFITTVQPAAKAGAALRVIIEEGKFHGVTITQTPTGCL